MDHIWYPLSSDQICHVDVFSVRTDPCGLRRPSIVVEAARSFGGACPVAVGYFFVGMVFFWLANRYPKNIYPQTITYVYIYIYTHPDWIMRYVFSGSASKMNVQSQTRDLAVNHHVSHAAWDGSSRVRSWVED